MIRKQLVKLRTKFALKRNDAIRISDGYVQAKSIGILHSHCDPTREQLIDNLQTRLKNDGKKVNRLVFVPRAKKNGEKPQNSFSEMSLKANGKWKDEEVKSFQDSVFDYLISLDWETNKYTRNILAACKAKCRVGRFEEEYSEYFELMLQHGDDNFEAYLDQLYHYLKNMRNE